MTAAITVCSAGCRAAGTRPEKCRCSCHGERHGADHLRDATKVIELAHAPNCTDRTLRSSEDIFNRSIVRWRCLGCGAVVVRPKGEAS